MGIFSDLLGTKEKKKKEKEENLLPVLPEQIRESALNELQDIIAPPAAKIEPRSIHFGDKISRTFYIIAYPRYLTDNWFSPIINIDQIIDVSIFIHPIDTSKILKKFQKKVAEVRSQIEVRKERGVVRDPMLDSAHQDLERLRDDLQQAQEKMFNVGVYITIYAENEKELQKAESRIKTTLESKMIYLKPALFQQEDGFISTIPAGKDNLLVHQKLNSGPLSTIFPFVSFDLTSNEGILYGVNRHNSSLVIFDRFTLENYNSVIFAKSGAGKSYATKLEILRTLMFDTSVIVIDPEREYEYLAEAVGGRYINISLSSSHHINPFDLPMPREDEAPADVLRSNIIQLVGLFRILLGGLTPEEDALIDRAISETYSLKDITPESDFSNIEPPLLSDFEMVLSGMDGTETILRKISKYTKGSWSNFINQPTNIDLDRKFIVFSVRDLEDELKPAAMYLVTHFIWNAVRKNLKKRLLVVDEAWWMMKSEDTASFLFGIAKRGRKYYLGLATITQDVEDFMKSSYGKPIVTNSSLVFLMKQSPSAAEVLQDVFNLTDEEKFLLMESEVGEGIFFAGLKHIAIKVVASYTEDQIITSDPSQILAIQKAKDELQAHEDTQGEDHEETLAFSDTTDDEGMSVLSDTEEEGAIIEGEEVTDERPQESDEAPQEPTQEEAETPQRPPTTPTDDKTALTDTKNSDTIELSDEPESLEDKIRQYEEFLNS